MTKPSLERKRAKPIAHLVAILAALAVSFSCPRADAQTEPLSPAKLEEAKRHMEAGAAFYNDPSGHKCEEAYREFKLAYELSGSLNAAKGVGVCALELERDGDAIQYLQRYLDGKGKDLDPAERTQVESDLKALNAAIAWVTIRTNKPSIRLTDTRTPSRGSPITNRYTVSDGARLGIHPGQHTFVASVEGETDLSWGAEIMNGSSVERRFEFIPKAATPVIAPVAPPPTTVLPLPTKKEESRPISTSVYIAGGVTLALAIPTAIFAVSAAGTKSDYDDKNGKVPSDEANSLKSDVDSANLRADIFLGATIVGLATTAVLYAVRPKGKASIGLNQSGKSLGLVHRF